MGADRRAWRYRDRAEVVGAAADRLLGRLIEWQQAGATPELALSGGPLAQRTLAAFAQRAPGSSIDPTRLGLWWTDDAFVPSHGRQRHSLRALSLLGGVLPLDPARVHPVPAAEAYADPEAAAHAYALDLAPVTLDLCLLELGPLGQVASLFPGQRGLTAEPVVGITDAPGTVSQRVSLGLTTLNAAREIWVLASGAEVAGLVAASFAGAPNLPSARLQARERTWWFLDEAAAQLLPYHTCQL